jgi:hypothetical protein
MRAQYGKKLCGFLAKQSMVELIVDLGGQKVFESATVDTCIVKFRRRQPPQGHMVLEVPAGSDFTADTPLPAYVLTHGTSILQQKLATWPWTIATDAVLQLKEKISAHGTPLKEWKVNISYGIKTGLNEAFVIDTPTKEKLCRENPGSAEILKPLLRGRDISRYGWSWQRWWLIATFPSLHLNIRKYPAIEHYFDGFAGQLEQSGKRGCRKKTGNAWFETQDNIAYYAEFEKSKVVWPMVSSGQCSFAYVTPGMYLNNKCFMITGESISWLIALLNSSLAWFWFSHTESQLGSASIEIRTDAVWSFPVPNLADGTRKQLAQLAHQMTAGPGAGRTTSKATPQPDGRKTEHAIDTLVYAAYGLSAEEVALIESSVSSDDQIPVVP